MAKRRRYYSNLNRKPREGEYTTYDQRTGIRIWNTDVAEDFWGMQVHKNNVATPEALLYMDYNLPVEEPLDTSGRRGTTYQTGTWFVQTDENNNVSSIFYSDDYVVGLYTEATSTQITNYVPVFNDATYTVDYEDVSPSTPYLVASLSATDPAGEGLSWSITSGNDSSIFSIDPAAGKLYISAPGSITNDTDYELTVKVTSYFPGYPYDTADITVSISDVNDAPVITSGLTYSIAEGETAVTTMVATDQENDTITWSINGGADASLFEINSSSGALSFKSAPDYETPLDADTNNVYVVGVKASDGAASDTETLSITVTDVAETPDSFGTLELWLDASDSGSISQSGGAVSQWNDLSGNSRHFTQSNASFKPTYNATGFNGAAPAIEFNVSSLDGDYMTYVAGVNSVWNFLINDSSTRAAVFVVMQQTTRDAGTTNAIIQVGSTNTRFQLGIGSNTSGSTFRGEVDHSRVSSNSALMNPADMTGFNTGIVYHSKYEPASTPRATLYVNNSSVNTSTDAGTMAGATNLGTTMYMGTNEANAGAANSVSYRGRIAEVLIYSECSDISVPYNYLADKWNI